jgi:hypothetical protein
LPPASAVHFDAVRAVDEPVENTVCQRRIADLLVNLACRHPVAGNALIVFVIGPVRKSRMLVGRSEAIPSDPKGQWNFVR